MPDVIDLKQIRNDFPALRDCISFDNGTVSLTPRPVAAALDRYLRDVLEHGPPHVVRPDEEYALRDSTRATIAAFLGTTPDRIALTRGVSEAFHAIIESLDWSAGDELVLSEDEEAAILLPAAYLRDMMGIRLVTLPLGHVIAEGPQSAVDAVVTARTRLIALSHVTTSFGLRYPVRQLCAAARERGVLTFIDVAHSAGVAPLDLEDVGCDTAGMVSYKWMCGPYAAGALYVRPDALSRLRLRFAGGRSQEHFRIATAEYRLREDARRYEYGPWAWALVHAWAEGVAYLTRLGPDKSWERISTYARVLGGRLAELECVRVITPLGECGPLVAFEVEGLAADEVRDFALARGIRLKALQDGRRLRASIAVFTSLGDVEALVETIAAAVAR